MCKERRSENAEPQEQTTSVTQTSPEQQAAIDAIDKPNLDEKILMLPKRVQLQKWLRVKFNK